MKDSQSPDKQLADAVPNASGRLWAKNGRHMSIAAKALILTWVMIGLLIAGGIGFYLGRKTAPKTQSQPSPSQQQSGAQQPGIQQPSTQQPGTQQQQPSGQQLPQGTTQSPAPSGTNPTGSQKPTGNQPQ